MAEDERITRGMKSQLGDRRRAIARDDRGLGWKLGFGTPAAMQKLGTEAPLVGYLLESARLESGAVVDISNWDNPRLADLVITADIGDVRHFSFELGEEYFDAMADGNLETFVFPDEAGYFEDAVARAEVPRRIVELYS